MMKIVDVCASQLLRMVDDDAAPQDRLTQLGGSDDAD